MSVAAVEDYFTRSRGGDALFECVERGLKLFDEVFGAGWEENFINKPIKGVLYTHCKQCVADIASGLPGQDGYELIRARVMSIRPNDRTFYYGLDCFPAEEEELTRLWNEAINKRLEKIKCLN